MSNEHIRTVAAAALSRFDAVTDWLGIGGGKNEGREYGRVNFYVDRWDATAERRKQFSPVTLWRTAAGKLEWRFKGPPAPQPLYGLPSLAKAAPVVIVEGEKAADAAAILLPDHPVVTWQGGSGAVGKADFSPLAGHEVWLWPDNDEAGTKAMQAVAARLSEIERGRA